MLRPALAALAALLLASPASAGNAFDNAVVALTAASSCSVPVFTEPEADALIVLAARLDQTDPMTMFALVAEASDALQHQMRSRGTTVPFCIQAARIAASMPRA